MDRPTAPNMYPQVAGYPPVANFGVHPHPHLHQHQQQQQQQPYQVQYQQPYANTAPVYGNPYLYAQEVRPPHHNPDCRYYSSPDRRNRNGIANALAAIFIVCWCCTWPCHGPCCCGF